MKTFVVLAVLLLAVFVESVLGVQQAETPASAGDRSESKAPPSDNHARRVKAASNAATVSSPIIRVNNRFTEEMAKNAGLEAGNPQLSADGIHSGTDGNDSVASSECLFAETVVQQTEKLTLSSVEQFCNKTKTDKAGPYEEELQGDTKTKHMDEALIHIVQWRNGQPNGTWYYYKRWAGRKKSGVLLPFSTADAITSPPDHLLGRTGLGFLAIHLDIDDSCDISYDIASTHTKPLNQQDVEDLISLAKSYYGKGKAGKAANLETAKGTGIGIWGGQQILSLAKLPAQIVLTPSVKKGATVSAGASAAANWDVHNTCNSKTASLPKEHGVSNPASQLGNSRSRATSAGFSHEILTNATSPNGSFALISAQKGTNSKNDKTEKGTAPGTQPDSPKDDKPGGDTGSTPDKGLAGNKLTVQDEGLHRWDVSVALPVTSYKKLTFSSDNNTVTVKNTNDIKPYALFDFYLSAADLRVKNGISMPMIVSGIPLSSQPLQKPFVGGGFIIAIGSLRLQPLVGVRVEKDVRPTTLSKGGTASAAALTNDLASQWHAKLQVMLGFSVSDAMKVLGLKK